MTSIYVDHAKLDAAGRDFAAHHKTLTEILGDLESGLAPMIASWGGAAQAMYVEKKDAWDRGATDLADLLHDIAVRTKSAHEGYVHLVADNVKAWT